MADLKKEIETKGNPVITNPAPAAEYQGAKWSDLLDADSAVRYLSLIHISEPTRRS